MSKILYYVCASLPFWSSLGTAGLLGYLFTRNYNGITPNIVNGTRNASDANRVMGLMTGMAIDGPIVLFRFTSGLLVGCVCGYFGGIGLRFVLRNRFPTLKRKQ